MKSSQLGNQLTLPTYPSQRHTWKHCKLRNPGTNLRAILHYSRGAYKLKSPQTYYTLHAGRQDKTSLASTSVAIEPNIYILYVHVQNTPSASLLASQ